MNEFPTSGAASAKLSTTQSLDAGLAPQTQTFTLEGRAPEIASDSTRGTRSRPMALLYESASQPDLGPLLQRRMRLVAGILVLASLGLMLLVQLLLPASPEASRRYYFLVHGSGFLLNLTFFLVLLRASFGQRTLRFLQAPLFWLNAIVFGTLPPLEARLQANIFEQPSTEVSPSSSR